MQLTSEDIYQLYILAINTATKAGEYIAQHRPNNIQSKEAGSSNASQVVTEVDNKSQEIILKGLSDSIRSYDLGLLAEESDDDGSRLTKDFFWCVDPLDGTLPYIEGRAGYAVAISLIKQDGTPYIGVMYDPLTRSCYSAYKGNGAYHNGVRYVKQEVLNDYLTIIHHRSILKEDSFSDIIEEQSRRCPEISKHKLIDQGGAVMNAMWNLNSKPSVYFAYPKQKIGGGCIWDYASAVCFYNELGMSATTYSGKSLNLNAHDTIYMNKCGVLFLNI